MALYHCRLVWPTEICSSSKKILVKRFYVSSRNSDMCIKTWKLLLAKSHVYTSLNASKVAKSGLVSMPLNSNSNACCKSAWSIRERFPLSRIEPRWPGKILGEFVLRVHSDNKNGLQKEIGSEVYMTACCQAKKHSVTSE